MQSSFFSSGRLSHWRAICALMIAAVMMVSTLGATVTAQELETFDPDVAFGDSQPGAAPDEGAAQSVGAIDADLDASSTRIAPPLEINREAAPLPVPVPGPGAAFDPTAEAAAGVAEEEGFSQEFSGFGQAEALASQDPNLDGATPVGEPVPEWTNPATQPAVAAAADQSTTYGQDDLIGAAEGVFGKGAQGLAGLIEDLLRKQGEPNGYIVGREAGGAFVVGARYGSGTLHHKVEGQRKVYWTGPSVGFDAGANAGNTFVLVYNLYDSEDIFRRYPAGEGQAYLVGGLHASYMRRGDVVLIPIRVGAGLRLGVNAGYMRFSKKHRWLPF